MLVFAKPLWSKPSFTVSAASVSLPSSAQMRQSYTRDSSTSITSVFSKSNFHLLIQSQSHPSHPPARSANHLRPASLINSKIKNKSKATAGQPLFTSLRRSSRAQSQDQGDVIHTTLSWALTRNGVSSDLQWPGILTHPFKESLCLSSGSLVVWAAADVLQGQLAPSFMYFCPQKLKERRQTVNLWMRASWMSWTVR